MRIEQTASDQSAVLGTLEPRTTTQRKSPSSSSPTGNLYRTNTKAQDTKPKSSLTRKALSFSKWTGITLGYLALGLIALIKTPGMHRLGNHILQNTDDIPRPTYSTTNTGLEDSAYHFDSFFETHPQFDPIKHTASQFFDPSTLDTNKNHIILDTPDEANTFRAQLEAQRKAYQHTSRVNEINTAIKQFDKLNFVNQLIWGKSQDPKQLFQGSRPNCQLMGAVQAHFLIPEKIQDIKDTIIVTDYDTNPDNFYINTVVNLNGKEIPVSYDDLVKWMSPQWGMPSRSYDGALAIPILTYALEKELTENYDGVPPKFPSSSPILLTSDDYSVVSIHSSFLLNTMSDSALIDILKQAPEKQILVSTTAETEKIVKETKDWFKEKLGIKEKEHGNFTFLPTSKEKEDEFKKSTKTRAIALLQETPKTAGTGMYSIPDNTTTNTLTPNLPDNTTDNETTTPIRSKSSNFPMNHLYVVKKYNPENNTVELIDSHGIEYTPLSLEEFREKMAALVMKSEDVPTFTTESMKGYLLLLLAISGHVFVSRVRKKKSIKST